MSAGTPAGPSSGASSGAPAALPYWEDRVPGAGRLAPRADVLSDAPRLSLNGDWRFRLLPTAWGSDAEGSGTDGPGAEGAGTTGSGASEVAAFAHPSLDDSGWDTIPVPSHWVLEGHGEPLYTNTAYPFPLDPPHLPDDNPTGEYRVSFELPSGWSARAARSILRFQGVDSCGAVWLNGVHLGHSKGSRLQFEFDATAALRDGVNVLAVRVQRWSSGSYLEDQDMWWLPGVFRDVELLARPAGSADDVFVHASFDHETGSGLLRVEASDGAGAPMSGVVEVPELGIRTTAGATVEVPEVSPWSAEVPRLYAGTLRVGDEVIELAIGFRTVAIVDGRLLVNGVPVLMRGVNRHEQDADHGRALSVETMRQDILLMKRANINAVRTSHYPPHPAFLRLCDELGLWVVEECDIETHGFIYADWEGNPPTRPEWLPALADRTARMLERDKNHPSVVIWSMANESWVGSAFGELARMLRSRDPSRPVHYERDPSYRDSDFYSLMYPAQEALELIAARREPTPSGVVAGSSDDERRRGLPFLLCEYGHAMGNGPGSLADYQAILESSDRFCGAFVWEWIDHGFRAPVPHGVVSVSETGSRGEGGRVVSVSETGLMADARDDVSVSESVTWRTRPIPPAGAVSVSESVRPGAAAPAGEDDVSVSDSVTVHSPSRRPSGEVSVSDSAIRRDRVAASVSARTSRSSVPVTDTETGRATTPTYFRHGGDIDYSPNGGSYCIDGLLFPDRTPSPALAEYAAAISPVVLTLRAGQANGTGGGEPRDSGDVRLHVRNRQDVRDTAWLRFVWRMQDDGIDVASGELSVPRVSARSEAEIVVAPDLVLPPPRSAATRRWLTVSAVLAADEPWAAAGHEVAFGQLRLASSASRATPVGATTVGATTVRTENPAPSIRPASVRPAPGRTVRLGDAEFDPRTGRLLRLADLDLGPDGGPRLDVWRAPIENDRGQGSLNTLAASWTAVGLDRFVHSTRSVDPGDGSNDVHGVGGSGSRLVVRGRSGPATETLGFEWTFEWTWLPGAGGSASADADARRGSLALRASVVPVGRWNDTPHGHHSVTPPRLGLRLGLPGGYDAVSWLGLGPGETYVDSLGAARFGRWSSSVDALQTPYVVPQENGNHIGTRMLELSGRGVPTLRVDAHEAGDEGEALDGLGDERARGFDFTARRWTSEALARAAHPFELVDSGRVWLNLDHSQQGLGSASCGPALPDRYRVALEPATWAVRLSV